MTACVRDRILDWLTADVAADGLDPGELSADGRLADGGLVDSIRLMRLVTWLEEAFAIEVGASEMVPANFATVAAVTAMVERLAVTPGDR